MAGAPPVGPGIPGGGGGAPPPPAAPAPATPGAALLAALRARPALTAPHVVSGPTPATRAGAGAAPAPPASPDDGGLSSPTGFAPRPFAFKPPPSRPAVVPTKPIEVRPPPGDHRRPLGRGVAQRDTWAQMWAPDREHLAGVKFALNNYFEYHRRGHTHLHDDRDPDAPWRRAQRDRRSHWAVYRPERLRQLDRLRDDWASIYAVEPDDARLTGRQRRDVRARVPQWHYMQPGARSWDPRRIPQGFDRSLQDLIDAMDLPMSIDRVFRAGGNVSWLCV